MSQALWYYVSADRQRQGPVPEDELKRLLDAGSISKRSLVWRQGMPQWQPLEQFAHELHFAAQGASLLPPAPAADLAATRVMSLDALEPRSGSPASAQQDDDLRATYGARVGADPEAARGVMRDGPVVYAGFLKRFAASFVDGLIVAMAGAFLGGIIGAILGVALMGDGFGSAASSTGINALSTLFGVVLGLLYYGGFHASESQATPGKMLIGIKVARVDGDRLSPVRSGARFLATYINFFTLGIGWLMAAFTDRKQALHDFIADTVVVDRWAFTEFPERQSEDLGGCAIAILILTAVVVLASVLVIGAAVLSLSSGNWN